MLLVGTCILDEACSTETSVAIDTEEVKGFVVMTRNAAVVFVDNSSIFGSLDDFGVDSNTLVYYDLSLCGITLDCLLDYPDLVPVCFIVMSCAEECLFCLTERGDCSRTTDRAKNLLG